jgi:protein ImuB
MHSVVHAIGPERITGIWWEGHTKTRNYYEVELSDGQRWWLFQVQDNHRWFWHGVF